MARSGVSRIKLLFLVLTIETTDCREKMSQVTPKLGSSPLFEELYPPHTHTEDEGQFQGGEAAPVGGWLLHKFQMPCFSAESACPKLGCLLLLRNFLFPTVWSGSIRNWLHKLDDSVLFLQCFTQHDSVHVFPILCLTLLLCLTFSLSLWRIQCPRAVSNKTLYFNCELFKSPTKEG